MNINIQGVNVKRVQADRGENGEGAEVFEKNHAHLCTRIALKAKLRISYRY